MPDPESLARWADDGGPPPPDAPLAPPDPDVPQLDDYAAAMIAEGSWELAGVEPNEDTYRAAWQHLVDTGLAWRLQGWFGRTARDLIEAGTIIAPPQGRA